MQAACRRAATLHQHGKHRTGYINTVGPVILRSRRSHKTKNAIGCHVSSATRMQFLMLINQYHSKVVKYCSSSVCKYVMLNVICEPPFRSFIRETQALSKIVQPCDGWDVVPMRACFALAAVWPLLLLSLLLPLASVYLLNSHL